MIGHQTPRLDLNRVIGSEFAEPTEQPLGRVHGNKKGRAAVRAECQEEKFASAIPVALEANAFSLDGHSWMIANVQCTCTAGATTDVLGAVFRLPSMLRQHAMYM